MNENFLRKRLKYLMPLMFVVNAIITIAVYSVTIYFIYQQFTPVRRYTYFFMLMTSLAIAISIFFDFLKVERGKFVHLGIVYIFKTVFAFVVIAVLTYPIYILDGTMTLFEVLNFRLLIVLLFINFAASISSLSFWILVKPIYQITGKREYYIPMMYVIMPYSMVFVIFVLVILNGINYRSSSLYYEQYNNIVSREYISDAATSIYDAINEYVSVENDFSFYLRNISRYGDNLMQYGEFLSQYLNNRYGSDTNINAFYIHFYDARVSGIDINDTIYTNARSLNMIFNRNNNFIFRVNTNANLPIPAIEIRGANRRINIIRDLEYFYIYNPIVYNGNIIGFVALEVKSSIFIDLLNDYPNNDIFIANNNFDINAYNKMNFLGALQSLLNNPATSSELRDEANNNYLNTISDSRIVLNENYNLYFVKYSLFNDIYVIGVWEYQIPYRANMDFRRTILFSTLTIYVGLTLFAIVLFIIVIILRRTMVRAKNVADSLSEGSGDLTVRLPITNIDETGELVHSFNKFLDKMQSIITNIKENTYVLTGSVQNIRSSINIGVSDFESLNKEFKNEVANSNKIAESSSNAARVTFMQRTRINSVNEIIRQLLDNINEISEKMKSQSDAVNRTSVSVQQMMANIITVNQGSIKANNYSKTLDIEAREGGNISESLADAIQGIKDYSKQITSITNVIRNISEQTNLLSMNAAIEAAQAGEYGRGFTVVAEKIRKLAEDTANNSTVISDLIEETIQAIEQMVGLVAKSSESSDKIIESSNMLTGVINSISNANEELDLGRRDILNNVSNLNSITEAVQELSVKQMQMSSMVSQNISGVDKLAEDVVNVVNNTESDVKVLLGSIENVAQLSNSTVDSMENMDKKIKELQYIFLQLYKLVISFKTEKTEEEIKEEMKKLNLLDKIRIKLEKRSKKHREKEIGKRKKEEITEL
ncbi:methyl-accepting chemotaxis protein [Brachyspira catarrhinii]|nr:methyl-accepting chemotaxis protein [Brachyspira catarrhinii]